MKLILIFIALCFTITIVAISIDYFREKQKFKKTMNKLNKISKSLKYNTINRIDIFVYYINLDRSEKRKYFMEAQFRKFNIFNYKRIKAVDGKKLKKSHDNIDDITFTNNYKNLNNNELACLLSHLKAIKMAYDSGLDKVLILEDDCSLDLMFLWKNSITNIIKDLNKPDWEIFQLFTANCINFKSTGCTLQTKTKECWGCVAYVINRKGMEKIINSIKTSNYNEIILGKNINNTIFPSRGQSDIFLYQIAKTYYLDIPLFFVNNSNSFLKSTIALSNSRDMFNSNISEKIISHYINDFEKN